MLNAGFLVQKTLVMSYSTKDVSYVSKKIIFLKCDTKYTIVTTLCRAYNTNN